MTDAELPLADLTGKARIRHVALHLFATRGCAQTPLRLIAEKALVSLALISHHFGTKLALRDAVEKYIVSSFEKAIDAVPQTTLRRSDADAMKQWRRRSIPPWWSRRFRWAAPSQPMRRS